MNRRIARVVLVSVVSAFLAGAPGWGAPAAAPTEFFVATDGNDAWSGKLAAANAAKTDGPFASVTRARQAIRELKAAGPLTAPVRVLIRAGTYALPEPLQLGPEDTGTAECPITYAAYPGERPELSGGRVLTGWQPYRDGIRSCSLKAQGLAGLRFRQLFYRGDRQTMARWPNRDPRRPRTGGFLYAEERRSDGQLRYGAGAFPRQWARPTEVEVTIFPSYAWANPSIPLASLDAASRLIKLSRSPGEIWDGNRFYIQNALEELDAPGEWYLDREAETVYFRPPDDQPLTGAVVVPALKSLVLVQGDFAAGRFVEHVTLSHLGLAYCEQDGVVLKAARHCGVVGATLSGIGGAAVVIGAGSSFCRIAGNDIPHPGGHAVAMYYDTASQDTCTDNVITNNYAHHCGEVTVCSFGWGSGICVSGRRNVASHNLVHDTAYNAFNFDGWDNVIEYNRIHHSSLECDDCAGIYGWVNTRGGSGRNIIRYNHVSDSIGYGRTNRQGRYQSPHMSFGIYLDDYLSETTVHGNLVYRAWNGCLMLHGGWNNTVTNNVFVDGALAQVQFSNMPRNRPVLSGATGKDAPGTGEWTISGIVLQGNIIVSQQPDSAIYRASQFNAGVIRESDRNVVWNQGNPVSIAITGVAAEGAWQSWQALGRDANSLVADPRFVNPQGDDYRLQPASPALKLGFTPLPLAEMGLVASPERASWPVVEPPITREPLLPPPVSTTMFNVPVARAYLAGGPIIIDGTVPPAEWEPGGGRAALVVERLAGSDRTSKWRPALRLLHDADNLYLGVVSPDARACDLEVLLQGLPENGTRDPFVLRASDPAQAPRVTEAGQETPRAQRLQAAVRSAAAVRDGHWTAEWQIPLGPGELAPATSQTYRLNLRLRPGPDSPWVGWASAADPVSQPAMAGGLTCTPVVAVGAANLVVNGDLEAGTGAPTGWGAVERIPGQPDGASKRGIAQWVTEGRDGSRCLKLEATDATLMQGAEFWWAQSFKSPGPGNYAMSYDLRVRDLVPRGEGALFYGAGYAMWTKDGKAAGMNLGWTDEGLLKRGSVPLWTRREVIFRVPADAETIYVLFGIEKATGTVWVDNVRLERCQ